MVSSISKEKYLGIKYSTHDVIPYANHNYHIKKISFQKDVG